ncbi:hypothetical protein B0H13DRAFT_2661945 [Mycena leptocephala]|nr:hypothetical protein B0H13DRAFT_2661945 [Mycena leptocephala]
MLCPPSMAPSEQAALGLRSTVLEEEGAQPVSPINLIPPELLCYIFTSLVPSLKSGSSSPIVPIMLGAPWSSGPWILGGPWLGNIIVELVHEFKYVGIWLTSTTATIFSRNYAIKAFKARNACYAIFTMKHQIGSLPVKEGLQLYMARVDCYLISVAEISIDVDSHLLDDYLDIQHLFPRHLLGINSRSMLTVLFTETGRMPIRIRCLLLALGAPRLRGFVCSWKSMLGWRHCYFIACSSTPIRIAPADFLSIPTIDAISKKVVEATDAHLQFDINFLQKSHLLRDRLELAGDSNTLALKRADASPHVPYRDHRGLYIPSFLPSLAVSLPSLWRSITVFATVSPRELRLLNIQLSRTESAPLHLRIRFTSTGHSPSEFDLFEGFLARLVSQSARWRVLHLEFDGGWLPLPSFATLSGLTLPLLEELAFNGPGVSSIERYGFLTDAPPLRRVVLGARSRAAIQKIALPWTQLASYKAFYPDAPTHFRNLAGAANLVECDFDFPSLASDEFTITQLDILTLPRLRRLAVSCPVLLDRLVAPEVQSLYIVGPVKRAFPFLDRSGCTSKLIELTLTRCAAPASEIISLLQHTRGLTALMLDVHERLCPTLGSLAWADFTDALDRGAFADMVVSRCTDSTGMRPLHSVVPLAGRRRLKTGASRMRALPGLEVVIMNPNKGVPALARWRDY